MKERPILFNADMVRAILDGRKTQTRRIVKPQPLEGVVLDSSWIRPFSVGQRLWVRETFSPIYPQDPHYNNGNPIEYDYKATYQHGDRLGDDLGIQKIWKPSIHMPREASRITLEVTGVRVERLQDIEEEDAVAEGIEQTEPFFDCPCWRDYMEPDWETSSFPDNPVGSYASLWESIHGPKSWNQNPWVWVIEFRRVEP